MEENSNENFFVFEKNIKNNIMNWYPYEKDKNYIVLKDFNKSRYKDLLDIVSNLKENDRIIILMNNKLSIKNVCQEVKNQEELYNRNEIEKVLNDCGLIYRKFYYPLPSCDLVNVIFTDSYLPDKEMISRDVNFYSKNTIIKNEEQYLFKKLIEQDQNLFKLFANSFFIVCSNTEFVDNDIKFVSFSNIRKEEYQIRTIINGKKVYKTCLTEKSKKHIENIKNNIDLLNKIGLKTLDNYDNDTIISEFQENTKTFDKLIIDMVKKNQKEDAVRLIDILFNKLKEKLYVVNYQNNVFDKYRIEYRNEDIQNLTFIKYGLWDMIFQNIFYKNDDYYFYDQEWIEENLPLEYIVYRTFNYNLELQKELDLAKIYKKYGINDKNINLFKQLDNKLQEKTRNDIAWRFHINIVSSDSEINKLNMDKEKILSDSRKLLNAKDARIKFLEDNMEKTVEIVHLLENENKKQVELIKELQTIKKSRIWKAIELFRKIKNKLKKFIKRNKKNEIKR